MNTGISSKVVLVSIAVVAVLVGAYVYWACLTDKAAKDASRAETGSERMRTYTSERYGLSFKYPESWRVGDDRLEEGTFQLKNYPESAELPTDFARSPGEKIEMHVGRSDDPVSFFEGSGLDPTETVVAGQRAFTVTDEYGIPNPSISYAIEIPSHPDHYLTLSLSGDLSERDVLELILRSITWK
jgi:hypothetical protein